ncbi:hypothetical protein [Clostridium taeniosporum]|uniref:Uncharacterized protein n=1 Tax=Clostridium taeniosporum TaxID=394958 RepID=A0A1D7XJH2_9CLOT|nr:hypothetical protein [Clostridium taeniosporum]AOR23340.1 hypothetical protein BGI42_06150 [Clostridium taeniosporum]
MKCNANIVMGSNLLPTTAKYFKEEIFSEILTIPEQKPDMERILKVLVSPEIVDINLVETEVGYSNEGQNLTGYKLVVELNIKEKITYVANEKTQSVHAAHFENMKSIFVVIPKEINGQDVCELVRANRISVTPYIEAAKATMLDCRRIHKCVMLFVDVKFC